MTPDEPTRTIDLVQRFNEKHGVTLIDQTLKLVSEVGELADEVLSRNQDGIREELGDVHFCVLSVALLAGIDLESQTRKQAVENLEKSTEKDGRRITKD